MNLLILCSDEHRADAIGALGHPIVRTPVLDALAARGTTFTRAYSPSPICVPARAALATGQPAHRIGAWDSSAAYDGTPAGWAHALREAGYRTASIGKLHYRSDADDHGFDEEILPMNVHRSIGWPICMLRDPAPDDPSVAELAADVGTGETTYTTYDRAVTGAACDWLETRGREDGTPWAAFVSLVSPHFPLRAPEAFAALYDGVAMDEAIPGRPDHPELQALARFFDYDRHFDDETRRMARVAYYGLVSFLDACLGKVLGALEASGQAEDTLILYTSDHGEMLGDHGFWTKQVMYEGSVAVPMILSGPGVPSGKRCATPVTLLDVAPTAAALAGVGSPGWEHGADLLALANAPDDPARSAFSEYHDGGSSTGAFMVCWDRWKYVAYAGMRPQLFDLAADPCERTDLGRSRAPDAAAARAEGEARLAALCDVDAVNAAAFADQRARVEAMGGREAVLATMSFGHTPAPSVQEA